MAKLNAKIGIVFFGILILTFLLIKPKSIEVEKEPILNKIQSLEEISIILVGDIMLDRGVELMIKKYNDWKWPFLKIAEELKKAEIVFGNLEGPISDKGTKMGSIYSFRNDPKVIEGLNFASFNILSLANNHAFDYGGIALEDTFLRLKAAGIDYVGAGRNEKEAFSPLIKEIKGAKIGFLAYTNLGPESWKAKNENLGIAWISEKDFEKIKEDIKKAKSQVDILIVSLHSGEEYQKEPTKFQKEFSKMAIEAGADLIVGHHPHVIQSNEIYKEKHIFYSLGNFVFDQSFSKETMEGQMIKILIENSKIKKVIPMKIRINQFFQPEILYE